MPGRVVIIMGSKSDMDHVQQIETQLARWGIPSEKRVASAHKSVRHLLQLLANYADSQESLVYITVAGRSNALGGMVDANTPFPVITCPPVSSTCAGADIYSSLRMPSGVAPTLVLDPKGAALAAAKVLALSDLTLRAKVAQYQQQMTDTIVTDDQSLA